MQGVHGKLAAKESRSDCPICCEEYDDGCEVIQMPCQHLFHEGCLLPWLEKRNTCPMCRCMIPSTDPEWDSSQRRRADQDRASDNPSTATWAGFFG
jgi:hypothetical protein